MMPLTLIALPPGPTTEMLLPWVVKSALPSERDGAGQPGREVDGIGASAGEVGLSESVAQAARAAVVEVRHREGYGLRGGTNE